MNVLNDNIANTIHQMKTFATNNTGTTNTNNRFVRCEIHAVDSSFVVSTSRSGIASTPGGRVQINSVLDRATARVGRWNAAFAVGAIILATELVDPLVD